MQRRAFITQLAAASAATSLPHWALAQNYPTQPIRVMGGFGSGSSSDVAMRLIAPHMQKLLGQPVVIDNVQGAAGNIAAAQVARAKADGYTLLSATNSMLGTNPHLFPASGVQIESFTPIAPITNIGLVVVAGPSAPASTLAAVLDAAKQRPVTYGTPGAGTPMHLIGEMLAERSKSKLSHIPYKGGSFMVTDLAAGQIDIGIVAYTPASGLIKAGNLRPLAVCGTSRLAALPNVPAVAEIVPGVTIGGWFALMAPAGTPASVCQRIAEVADQALSQAGVQAQLIEMGCDRLKGGPEVVTRLARSEYELSGDLIRRLNIRPS